MDWFEFISEQWLLVGVLAVLISALLVVERKRAGASVSFHEMTRLINQDQAVLVDLRDSKEFSEGHIVDALNIPFAKLNDRVTELEKHREKTIVVLDKIGQHTAAASKILAEKNFTVVRMQGGMSEWQAQSLPVIKGK